MHFVFFFFSLIQFHDNAIIIFISLVESTGKSTGFVTTTRVTHATPAALYAHAPSRYWEDDGKVPSAARVSCKDIAKQLLEDEPGRNINVIFTDKNNSFIHLFLFYLYH